MKLMSLLSCRVIKLDINPDIQYLVVKVYSKGGIAQVDRVLYNTSDKDSSSRRHVDTVYLGDVITYPIILGKPNPRYTGGVVQYPRGGLQPGEKASAMELDTFWRRRKKKTKFWKTKFWKMIEIWKIHR